MAAMPVVPRGQGRVEGAELVGRDAEGENVEPLVGRPAADQLRGHVVGRARAVARLHERPRGGHRQAEIDQLHVVRSLLSKKLRGQMSRWMKPAWWTAAIASAAWRMKRTRLAYQEGSRAARAEFTLGPSRYSISIYGAPSVVMPYS